MKKVGVGLAYADNPHNKLGSEIFIQIRNKNIPAKVVKLPFVS
jgi:aminomethyltransferase